MTAGIQFRLRLPSSPRASAPPTARPDTDPSIRAAAPWRWLPTAPPRRRRRSILRGGRVPADRSRQLATRQLQECEQFLVLEPKLRAILEGKEKPAND